MLKKKDCVIYSVIIYVVLILIAYLVRDNKRFNAHEVCRNDYPCARFCCENIKTCNEQFIRRHFNESLVPDSRSYQPVERGSNDESSQVKSRLKLMFGRPKCKLEAIGDDKNWNFTPTGSIWSSGASAEHDDYCLQDEKFAGNIEWSLYVCSMFKSRAQRNLQYALSAIASFFLAAIIYVYASFKSLRIENHGKILPLFFTGLIISASLVPYFGVREQADDSDFWIIFKFYAFFAGLIFALACLNVMCFDIWWTLRLRKFKATSTGNERLKFYKFYMFSVLVSALLGIVIIDGFLHISFYAILGAFAFFGLTALSNFAFLIMTGINISRTTLATSSKDFTWHQEEKKRFWMYLQVVLIMMITGPLEILSYSNRYENYDSKIVIDVLSCFSAVLMFTIFVFNEKTREIVFKRYSVLNIK